jgi:hypothetical protein
MKIAIYGDSFGYEDLLFNEYHPNIEIIGKSWVSYLRKEYEISNFCQPASDLYYSYNLFKENYSKFDKNIFLVTSSGRFSFKHNNQFLHSHSIASAQGKLKIEQNYYKKKALQAVINYFEYLQDIDKDQTIDRLIKEDIIKLDPSVLLIECFGKEGLVNITKQEDIQWNSKLTYSALDKVLDLRFSHMTRENNLILFKLVNNCLIENKKFAFDINNFYKPAIEQKNLYLVPKK